MTARALKATTCFLEEIECTTDSLEESQQHQQAGHQETDLLHAHGRLTSTDGPQMQEFIGQDQQVPHQFAGGFVQALPKAGGEERVQNVSRPPRLAHIDPAQFPGGKPKLAHWPWNTATIPSGKPGNAVAGRSAFFCRHKSDCPLGDGSTNDPLLPQATPDMTPQRGLPTFVVGV